jgi:hypothetical protein
LFLIKGWNDDYFIDDSMYSIVIPECLCREFSGFAVFKVAGSPTEAFGDDGIFCFLWGDYFLVRNDLFNKGCNGDYFIDNSMY